MGANARGRKEGQEIGGDSPSLKRMRGGGRKKTELILGEPDQVESRGGKRREKSEAQEGPKFS